MGPFVELWLCARDLTKRFIGIILFYSLKSQKRKSLFYAFYMQGYRGSKIKSLIWSHSTNKWQLGSVPGCFWLQMPSLCLQQVASELSFHCGGAYSPAHPCMKEDRTGRMEAAGPGPSLASLMHLFLPPADVDDYSEPGAGATINSTEVPPWEPGLWRQTRMYFGGCSVCHPRVFLCTSRCHLYWELRCWTKLALEIRIMQKSRAQGQEPRLLIPC